ncbi:MAG: polysaccharide export protein [Bacteroidetes bacterium]|nr:polysaccharide export protein [Fibrella sp.]
MKKHYRIALPVLLVLLLPILCVNCVSPQKLAYFQKKTTEADTLRTAARFVSTVQVGDVLSIQVNSLNAEASSFFNPYTASAGSALQASATPNSVTTPLPYTTGYLVDPAGAIEFPMLGKMKIAGLTNTQVSDRIRGQLKEYLKEPTVNVRNLNFRISVMGEVTRPSLFSIPNEQVSVLEALSLAGDITIYGRRDNVLIIRDEGAGKTFTRLDLTQRDLFRSPYYYLHPNDVIYVEPGKARVASADRTNQLLPIIISALSFLAIIASRF